MSRCRECSRAVIRARTVRGNPIVLDYAQVRDDIDAFKINGETAVLVPLVQRFDALQEGRRLYPVHRLFCNVREVA